MLQLLSLHTLQPALCNREATLVPSLRTATREEPQESQKTKGYMVSYTLQLIPKRQTTTIISLFLCVFMNSNLNQFIENKA